MYLRTISLTLLFLLFQQLASGQQKVWVKSDIHFLMFLANTSLKKADAALQENNYHFIAEKTSERNEKSVYSLYALENVNGLEIRKYHKNGFLQVHFSNDGSGWVKSNLLKYKVASDVTVDGEPMIIAKYKGRKVTFIEGNEQRKGILNIYPKGVL